MPSDFVITVQGQAWDMLSLARLGSEKSMGRVLQANVNEMDALLFAGNLRIEIPERENDAARSLPPWERM